MRRDWGFYHTTELNLARIGDRLPGFPALPDTAARAVQRNIADLHDAIERAPKTQKWKLRARVGERARWYEQVEEVNR
jgi:hypothetical protein